MQMSVEEIGNKVLEKMKKDGIKETDLLKVIDYTMNVTNVELKENNAYVDKAILVYVLNHLKII